MRLITILVVCLGLAWFFTVLAGWPAQPGDDWLWYRNGIDRMASGQPLYRPEWLLGSYNYVAPPNDHQFNQAPWLLPLVAPFALLPQPVDRYAWIVVTDVALAAAIMISLGGRPLRRLPTLLLLLAWGPTLMALVWGNIENFVALGVILWLVGHRRHSPSLQVVGLVLASLKIMPAIPLILLQARSAGGRVVIAALLIVSALAIPAVLLRGPEVFPTFIAITANSGQVDAPSNLSPGVWANLPMGPVRAAAVALLLAAGLIRRDWVAVAVGELAASAAVTNMYASWLIPAVLPVVARKVDWGRSKWPRRETSPADQPK